MSETAIEFQPIHDTYRSRILRYLTRLVGEPEAEDLAQNVFEKVSEGLKNFRAEASLSTWIYRIATNVAFDRLRSRAPQQGTVVAWNDTSTSESSLDEEEREVLPDQAVPSVETEVIRLEMNDCIKQVIDELSYNYRSVIVLHDIGGFRNQEIADILSVSLAVVKIRLHRARQELKKKFEAGCEFYRDDRNEFACDRKADSDPSAT